MRKHSHDPTTGTTLLMENHDFCAKGAGTTISTTSTTLRGQVAGGELAAIAGC